MAADLSVVQITDADDRVASGADPNGYVAAYLGTWTFGQGPQLPGLRDLTTYAASAAINSGLRNNIANTFTIGANADADGNNELSSAEILPLFPSGTHYAAKRAWQVLRDFSTVTLTTTLAPGRFWGMRTVLTYTILAQPVAQANDIVVTQKSANPSYGNSLGNVLANHSSVKSGANIGTILVRTIPIKQ